MDERCETCRFWKFREADEYGLVVTPEEAKRNEHEESEPAGKCRRFPPIVSRVALERDLPGGSRFIAIDFSDTPEVYSDEWCGEYQKGATQ